MCRSSRLGRRRVITMVKLEFRDKVELAVSVITAQVRWSIYDPKWSLFTGMGARWSYRIVLNRIELPVEREQGNSFRRIRVSLSIASSSLSKLVVKTRENITIDYWNQIRRPGGGGWVPKYQCVHRWCVVDMRYEPIQRTRNATMLTSRNHKINPNFFDSHPYSTIPMLSHIPMYTISEYYLITSILITTITAAQITSITIPSSTGNFEGR